MDVWSEWTVIAKTIAALDWWWAGVVAIVLLTGAIGVWSWVTERTPRRRVRAEAEDVRSDAESREVQQDSTRSAA
jgi:hypothetical protein